MIISETDNRKIDVKFGDCSLVEPWVEVTDFHRVGGSVWEVSVVSLSQDAALKLADLVRDNSGAF